MGKGGEGKGDLLRLFLLPSLVAASVGWEWGGGFPGVRLKRLGILNTTLNREFTLQHKTHPPFYMCVTSLFLVPRKKRLLRKSTCIETTLPVVPACSK